VKPALYSNSRRPRGSATLRFLCLLVGPLSLPAAESASPIQLRGIVSFSTNQLALFENTEAANRWDRELLLGTGQRQGNIEVLEINPAAGQVRIRNSLEVSVLGFASEPRPSTFGPSNQNLEGSAQPGSLRLQQAGPGLVFALYQTLVQRTLLRAQNLP